MSSYNIKAKNKETGEIVDVACIDDHFRHHVYGYFVGSSLLKRDSFDGKKALTREEFISKYEEVKDGS